MDGKKVSIKTFRAISFNVQNALYNDLERLLDETNEARAPGEKLTMSSLVRNIVIDALYPREQKRVETVRI